MIMKIEGLSDLNAATEVASRSFDVADVWWRGQASTANWKLQPKAHRGDSGYRRESNMIRRFR